MADSIYTYFHQLDPIEVKNSADPEEVNAGMRIYERQDFIHYLWMKPGVRLRAMVAQVFRVEFGCENGKLEALCKCGGTNERRCRHVIGALFTFCNLINDECLTVFFRDNKQHELLKTWFWSCYEEDKGDASGPLKFSLKLERSGGVSVRRIGGGSAVPVEFEDESEFADHIAPLLDRHDDVAGFQFSTSDKSYDDFSFDPVVRLVGRCLLDLKKGGTGVCCEIAVFDSDGSRLNDTGQIGKRLALRENAMELHLFDPEYREEGSPHLLELVQREGPGVYEVGAAGFNRSGPIFKGKDREEAFAGYVFSCAGKTAALQDEPLEVEAHVSSSVVGDETIYKMKFQCLVGGELDEAMLQYIYQYIMEIILPTRSEMRSARRIEKNLQFLDGWFLPGDKGRKFLPESESGADWLNGIVRDLVLQNHTRVQVGDGQWKATEAPVQAVGYAFAVIRRAMKVETVWLENGIQLRAAQEDMVKHLPILAKLLGGVGIKLRVEDKEVETIPLQIEVAARMGEGDEEGIDWFELHPTVRMHGRTLTGEEWLEIIRQEGVIWTDEGLAVVEADDLDLLSSMHDLVDASDPLEQGIVQVGRLEIFKWIELKQRGMAIEFPDEMAAMFSALANFETLPEVALPKKLKATLRPYQHQGYAWLAFLYTHRFGACLADDMGLGKTLQTIALLAAIKEGVVASASRGKLPHLVVVPSSLVFNWCHEIAHFYPQLSVYEYLGSDRKEKFGDADVVITTYGTLARSAKKLKNRAFDIAVFDEAQSIKNIRAERTGAARSINASFKLCLTGTPVENHVGEYYSIMDLAVPGLLGSYGEFARRDDAVEMAVSRTRPFILRRTKDAILTELPPKVEHEIHLELSPLQKECYTRTVAEVKAEVAEAFEGNTSGQASIVALTALLRLRQVCVSPAIHDKTIDELSPKLDFLGTRLTQLGEEGHAALVFSQFTRSLDLIEEHLDKQGVKYLRLDGKVPVKKRKALVESFQKTDGPPVFLISLKAGGVGLNLTRASYVYHVDPWWNPAAENQASDRAHRMGQQQTVFVTRLIMRHTVEEKIMLLKQEKQAIFDAIVSGAGDKSSGSALSREDFAFLLE